MCGRFVAAADPDQLALAFDVDERRAAPVPPSWNVAPTMDVHAVAEHDDRRHLVAFRWGLVPSWADDVRVGARMINARRETVADKPAFRTALQRRRCLIPADGFYEWRHRDHGRPLPHFIHRADGRPMAFAGLWEAWRQPDGAWLRTCAIVTGAAGGRLRDLHDRMPMILPSGAWEAWLDRDLCDADAALGVLDAASADGLRWHPVSTDVNDVANDHAGLLAPVDPDAGATQPTLDL